MVRILDKYYFKTDLSNHCYVLIVKEMKERYVQRSKVKSGEVSEVETVLGYYTSIESLIKAAADDMVNRKAYEGSIANIHEWLTEYKSAVGALTDAINGKI